MATCRRSRDEPASTGVDPGGRASGGGVRWGRILLLVGLLAPRLGAADPAEPLTLEQALQEARRANAALPVARFQAEQADAAVREAQGLRLPSLAFDGDVHGGTPRRYASFDARTQLVAQVPVFDRRLGANVNQSLAAADAARAGFRRAELDLDRDVRGRFAECLEAEREIAFRQAGQRR